MTILQVQIFVLLLGAFLLGAATACLFRRAFARKDEVSAASAGSAALAVPAADTARFGRALSGDPAAAVPTPFHSFKAPVVEVQPVPSPAKAEPVARQPEPVVRQPEPPPPAPVVAEPLPVPPAPIEQPQPPPAPEPEPPAEVAAYQPPAEPEPLPPAEPEPPAAADLAPEPPSPEPLLAPPPPPRHEPSYTEVAAAANAAAAALAAQAAAAAPLPSFAEGPADDLTRIRGIDVALQDRLNELGVRTFAAVAGWTASDVARVSQTLGFHGRIQQENWIEQAQILAKGGVTKAALELVPADVAAAVAVPLAADRLHRIIGIDPATEEILVANGVTRIADIAAWTWQDVEKIEALIGKPGRVGLENWIEQARFLTRGGAPREHAPIGTATEAPAPAAPEPVLAPQPEPIAVPKPVPEPVAAADAPLGTEGGEPSGARSETSLAGLRSVRSEALIGDAEPSGEFDDLKRIRGIGVLIERKLYSLGVTSYEQVANWTSADVERISQVLDFKGRIERENWVEQARILASGGQTEFSRRADGGEV